MRAGVQLTSADRSDAKQDEPSIAGRQVYATWALSHLFWQQCAADAQLGRRRAWLCIIVDTATMILFGRTHARASKAYKHTRSDGSSPGVSAKRTLPLSLPLLKLLRLLVIEQMPQHRCQEQLPV